MNQENEAAAGPLESLPNYLPWIVGLVSLCLLVIYALVFRHLPATETPSAWGTFGDYLGGVLNPLVSTFTLVVAVRVWQQQKVELEQTKEALKEQAKTAEQQRQEQRFFDLLNVYQQTISAIFVVARMPSTNGEFPVQYTGKEAIAQFLRSSNAEHLVNFDKNGYGGWTGEFDQISNRKGLLGPWNHEAVTALFDHYFRVVFRILSEVEVLLGEQHFRYIKLFRAQLSRSELIVLGFNLWLDDEGGNMVPLAEKYGLLKHLPKGHLRSEIEKLHPRAFGRRRVQALQPVVEPQTKADPC